MNIVHVAGNLGADPEVRFTSSGQKVTTLRVAARTRKGKTIWWKVTIWGEQFDKMISYLKKGSSVIVIGEMQDPEIFTNREGVPQTSMGITAFSVMFSPFGKGHSSEEGGKTFSQGAPASSQKESTQEPFSGFASGTQGATDSPIEDEIPF